MPPNFRVDQPTGAGSGTAGNARDGIYESRQCELHDVGTGMASSREWLIDSKPFGGGSATIVNPTSTPALFTPPSAGVQGGTYKITLRYDGYNQQLLPDGSKDPTYALKNKSFVLRVTKDSSGTLIPELFPLPAYLEENADSDGISGQGLSGAGYHPLFVAWRLRFDGVVQDLNDQVASLSASSSTYDLNNLVLRDNTGSSEFGHVIADQILALTNTLLIQSKSGSYITFWEGLTEVAQLDDNAGTRSFRFQGAVPAEITSGGTLTLGATTHVIAKAASGSQFQVFEGTNKIATFENGDPFSVGLAGSYLDLNGNGSGVTYIHAGSFVILKTASSFRIADGNGIAQINVSLGSIAIGNSFADVLTIASQLNIPIAAPGSLVHPPAGTYALFFNSANSDKLTKMRSDGSLTVIGTES